MELHKHARRKKRGAKYPDMACCLMAYLSYEAYLNLLLSKLDPVTWAKERTHFSKGKFRGTEGKLRWIAGLCGKFSWKRGARPYQTVKKLEALRDRMVHAKPYSYADAVEHPEDREPDWWPRHVYAEVDPTFARTTLKDVECFMEYVHSQVVSRLHDPWLKAGALKGVTGYATSSTSVAT